MTDIVKVGFEVETASLKKGQAELDKMAKSGSGVDKSMSRMGKSAGQASIQIQQFVGQVQGGTSAAVALSQQAADLGIVLGFPLLGAVTGIAAAFAGPLISSLIGAEEEVKDLNKVLKELERTSISTESGVTLLSERILELAKRSEALAKIEVAKGILDAEEVITTSIAGISKAIEDSSEFRNLNFVVETAGTFEELGISIQSFERDGSKALSDFNKNFRGSAEEYSTLSNRFARDSKIIEGALNELSRDLGISRMSAASFIDSLAEFDRLKTPAAAKRLENSIAAINEETGFSNEKFIKLSSSLTDYFVGITTGVEKTNDLRMALSDITRALKEADVVIGDSAKTVNAQAAVISGLAQALANQNAELRMSKDEFELYRIEMMLLAENVAPEAIKSILELAEANQRLRREITLDSEGESLIQKIENIGGAWTKTGNAMVDAFGDAASAIDNYSSRMTTLIELQEELNEKREQYQKAGKSTLELDEAQAKLNSENLSAQLDGIGSILGASKNLFDEQSKGRKAIHALEMGFMAAEIVLATEKAIVSAIAAIANQGSGDPYSAFGRVAAMAGIMAGVLAAGGIAFGGGGGGGSAPTPAGTGTVLGDASAQTMAIENAFEDMQDIEIDQLAELKGLRDDIRAAFSGIGGLASMLVSGVSFDEARTSLAVSQNRFASTFKAGDIYGKAALASMGDIPSLVLGEMLGYSDDAFDALFGVSKKLVDSGIEFYAQSLGDILDGVEVDAALFEKIRTKKKTLGIKTSDRTKTYLDDLDDSVIAQLTGIYQSIGSAVITATELLSMDAEDAINSFVFDIGQISLKGKTGEEVTEELTAAFSEQADLLATSLIPELTRWQEIGESSFDTLVRVATEQAYFNDVIDQFGLSISELSSVMQIDVTQAIAGLTGGFDNFSELANSYYDSFFSDSEKFLNLQTSLSESFDELGLSLTTSREGFRSLVESVDLTTESGQAMFASLLELAPAMDDYIDQIEQAHEERLDGLNSEKDSLSGLISSIDTMVGNTITVEQALQAARQGDFSLAQSIGQLGALSASSTAELAYAEALRAAQLSEIADLAGEQMSEIDKQIMELESQTSLLADQLSVLEAIEQSLAPVDTSEQVVTTSASGTAKVDTSDSTSILAGIAQNTAYTASILKQIQYDGIPQQESN